MLALTGQVPAPPDEGAPVRITAPLLTVVGTVAGLAAAVVAYQSAAGTSAPAPASSTTTQTPAPVAGTSWLPCDSGWTPRGDTCVRVQERVVVVHDLAAMPSVQQARAVTRSSGAAHESGRDRDEDRDETNEVRHQDDNEVEDSDADEVEHEDEADHEDEPDHEDVGWDD
jgi:hypothetical protein